MILQSKTLQIQDESLFRRHKLSPLVWRNSAKIWPQLKVFKKKSRSKLHSFVDLSLLKVLKFSAVFFRKFSIQLVLPLSIVLAKLEEDWGTFKRIFLPDVISSP